MNKKHSSIWKASKSLLAQCVKNSITFTEVLRRIGNSPRGSNIAILRERLRIENIPFDHLYKGAYLAGTRALKEYMSGIKLSNTELFIENSPHARSTVKKRAMAEGLLKNECALCGLKPMWNNKPLVLILDHINGVRNDCRRENLRLVCPNCNSQLETFGARNKRKGVQRPPKKRVCTTCQKPLCKKGKHGLCMPCYAAIYTRTRPEKDMLAKDIADLGNNCAVGRKYTVSEAAVRKWRKLYAI